MERYLAFISYRHVKTDMQVSAFLRRYLENWHLPSSCTLPKKRRVFRDTDELPTSTDLGNDIEQALQNSDYLITICSEEYVTSKWCLREIERYIEMGKKDRILPVLISGTEETAIPPQLKGIPPVLDLREMAGSSGTGSPDHDRLPEVSHNLRKDVYEGVPHLLQLMSGTEEKELSASQRHFRTLAGVAAFAGAAVILLGLILYTTRTADRIAQNNQAIAEATEEALQAEQQALERRDAAYLDKASLLARKAWIAIGAGEGIAAIQYSLEALPEDLSSDLPVSTEALNTLRTALVMPEVQSGSYHLAQSYPVGSEEALDVLKHVAELPKGSQTGAGPSAEEEYLQIIASNVEVRIDVKPVKEQIAELRTDGSLTIRNFEDNRVVCQPEGTFRYILFPPVQYQIYTVAADGSVQLRDSITGNILTEMKPPAPVSMVSFCENRGQLLALCEDCVAVLHGENGDMLFRIPLSEPARWVTWSIPNDGNRFVILYDDHIDIYELDTADQLDRTIFVPLSSPEASKTIYHAGYSPDGTAVYVEDWDGNLFKYDAGTGELLWINWKERGLNSNRRVAAMPSADGTCLWRQLYHMGFTNMEKIDAETGELLYATDWKQEHVDGCNLLESPDGKTALVMGMYYDERMILFDTETGELLWCTDPYGYSVFSEDGTKICCLSAETGDGLTYHDLGIEHGSLEKFYEQELELVYRILSAETGEILEERSLMNLGSGIKGEIQPVDDPFCARVEGKWEADLQNGTVTPLDQETIDLLQNSHLRSCSSCTFAGQDALLKSTYEENYTVLTRLVADPEGTIIFDAGERDLAVSPTGDSLVIYDDDYDTLFTPVLIWASDAQTLVLEGKKRLEEVDLDP